MKVMKYLAWGLLIASAFTLASCEKIGEGDRQVPYEGAITSERKVLLEDFTGVRCVNCPNAAAEIKKLQAFYGENIIVVGHYPRVPVSLTNPFDMTKDFRTDYAQTYADAFKIESLPKGLINRHSTLYEYPSWAGVVTDIIRANENFAKMSVTASLSSDSTQINAEVEGSFVADYTQNGAINVIFMVVEDSIVAPQLEGSKVNSQYVHNHVLRTVLGPAWGNQVLSALPTNGTTFALEAQGSLDASWNKSKLGIVAALVNAETKEVIQAAYNHVEE